VVPILTGGLADALSISGALILPALCYLAIAGFGRSARHPVEG
jgi:MFS transporter, FHS family, L-fucose permease